MNGTMIVVKAEETRATLFKWSWVLFLLLEFPLRATSQPVEGAKLFGDGGCVCCSHSHISYLLSLSSQSYT
jgi:hypothetical protein